jgi:hypothetical protein
MALTEEVTTQIQTNIAGVKKAVRSGLSYENFLDDHSSLIANTEKNLPQLIQAGLDGTKMPYYRGCLVMLAAAIANRSGADPETEKKVSDYDVIAKTVIEDRKKLLLVGRSIAKNCGNRVIQQKIKHILKGSGDMDNALDILGLVPILKKFPILAARIRPEGILLDEAFCKAAMEKALNLLTLKGYVIVNGVPQNSGTDYIGKLVTLCITNQNEIKEFAEAAFLSRPDYYKANFTSKYKKRGGNDTIDDLDEPDVPDDNTEDTTAHNPIDAIAITNDTKVKETTTK